MHASLRRTAEHGQDNGELRGEPERGVILNKTRADVQVCACKGRQRRDHHGHIRPFFRLNDRYFVAFGAMELNLAVLFHVGIVQDMLLAAMAAGYLHSLKIAPVVCGGRAKREVRDASVIIRAGKILGKGAAMLGWVFPKTLQERKRG